MIKLYNKEDLKYSIIFFNKKPPLFLTVFILFSLCLLIILLLTSMYTHKVYIVKGDGTLVSNETYYHTSFTNGVIKNIKVGDGDFVNKGDIILEIDDGSTHSELNTLLSHQKEIKRQYKIIELFKKSLEDGKNYLEKDSNNYDYYQKTQYYLSILSDDITSNIGQQEMLNKRITKQNTLVQEITELKKKSDQNSKNLIESKKDLLSSLDDEISSIKNNLSIQNSQSKQVYYQMIIDSDAKMTELNKELTEINNKSKEAKKLLDNLTVRADKNGVLHYLSDIKKGVAVIQGQTLANITPDNTSLMAEVFINASDYTKVQLGDKCNIEVIGTNTRKAGTLKGKIVHIDSGPINKEDKGTIKTLYRLEIDLEEKYLLLMKKNDVKIDAFMPILANIIYDKESYFDWILELLNFS